MAGQEDKPLVEICAEVVEMQEIEQTTREAAAKLLTAGDDLMKQAEVYADTEKFLDDKFKGTAYDPSTIGNKPYWNSKEDDMTDNQEEQLHVGAEARESVPHPEVAPLGSAGRDTVRMEQIPEHNRRARRIVQAGYISVQEQLRLIDLMVDGVIKAAERKRREDAIAKLSDLSKELDVILSIDIDNTKVSELEKVADALYKLKMTMLEHGGAIK